MGATLLRKHCPLLLRATLLLRKQIPQPTRRPMLLLLQLMLRLSLLRLNLPKPRRRTCLTRPSRHRRRLKCRPPLRPHPCPLQGLEGMPFRHRLLYLVRLEVERRMRPPRPSQQCQTYLQVK